MRRRHLLGLTLAGTVGTAVGGTSARAQPAPQSPALQSAQSDPFSPAPSDAAAAHRRGTTAVGAESLLVSRVAQAKLRHPMTRQFAEFEIAEQIDLADVLKPRPTRNGKPVVASAPPTDAEVEGALDDDGRAAVAKFRDMSVGPEFEKSYVQAQLEGHRKLLGIQDAYLQTADDAAETAIAKLARGRIQEHLVILGDITRHLG